MLNTLLLLLFCELLGEGVAQVLPGVIPGPVLGMFLLLGVLVLQGHARPSNRATAPSSLDEASLDKVLNETATQLLSHLSLLFVPAGVGVVVYIQRIGSEWLALGAALLLSTGLTLAVTAWTMQWMLRLQRGRVLVHD